MNFATRALLELQETTLLAARAFRGIFKRPRYIPETIAQMDAIGVGSLTIIILTGFFTGGVLTVQTFLRAASAIGLVLFLATIAGAQSTAGPAAPPGDDGGSIIGPVRTV